MFVLPPLPYAFDALEPVIDTKTVELHYTKHHQTYCDKLNAGIVGTEYEKRELEQLLFKIHSTPHNLQPIIRNHGWGLYNHNVYRATMKAGGSKPSANFKEIINKSFASREGFKEQFITKATTLFGSGWVRLELSNDKLEITHYINQENPLMYGKKPVLGLDVREHAYYLHYQNRRPDYINAWWEIIDRAEVENRLA